jgi:hypothetical protein
VTEWTPTAPNPAPAPASSAQPAATVPCDQPQVTWYRSQRFIALCQSTVLLVLGWLGTALATNEWAWRAIALSILGNIVLQLKDWWSPAVVAPFAAMNKSNPNIKTFKAPGS